MLCTVLLRSWLVLCLFRPISEAHLSLFYDKGHVATFEQYQGDF